MDLKRDFKRCSRLVGGGEKDEEEYADKAVIEK